jgi:hypothetical protein
MGPNASITVRGTLVAQGTESQKIVFTSYRDDSFGGDTNGDWDGTSPGKGDWNYISFTTGNTNCALSHVIVRYAGGSASSAAINFYSAELELLNVNIEDSADHGIKVDTSTVTITNATIARCDRRGLLINTGDVEITDSTFADNQAYDIYTSANTIIQGNTIDHGILVYNTSKEVQIAGNTIQYDNLFPLQVPADLVGTVLSENSISQTDDESTLIVLGQTITKDALWADTFRYLIETNIIVQGADGEDQLTTLTISEGVELRFKNGANLTVGGYNGNPGAIDAQGTLQHPIRFTSAQDAGAGGYWDGLRFYSTTDDATTQLKYCIVEHVGNTSNFKAIDINQASPTINQCAVRNSTGIGIYIMSGSPQISASTISGCGKYGLQIQSGSPLIDGNSFSYNANYDLYISNGNSISVNNNVLCSGLYVGAGQLASLDGNTIHYNSGFPIRLIADDIGVLMGDNTVVDFTPDCYVEVISGTISRDALWPGNKTYHILGNITIKGKDGADSITTLTVGAGAELRFNRYTNFYVGGYSGDPGALVANGTAETPIVFTSNQATPAAGDWYGFTFYNTTDDATTRLANCIIEYAGSGTSGRAIYIYNASPTITYCIIRYSQGDGIYTMGGAPQIIANTISDCGRYGINVASGAPTINGNTFAAIGNYNLYLSNGSGATVTDNNLSGGIYVSNGSLGHVSGNSIEYDNSHPVRLHADDVGAFFNDNNINNIDENSYVEVTTGTISRDALWPGNIAYHILGNITVKGKDGADSITTLTISAGAELRFNRYTNFYVGYYSGDPGALVANGTAETPIVFTSNQATPAAGDWYGFTFYTTTDDATTRLAHCNIEYAGYGTSGKAIYVYNASPTITDCTVRFSQGYGVRVDNGSPEIINSTISDTVTGIYVYSGTPVIYGNKVAGNSSYGLHNRATPNILAQENWWGHISGPYHASTNPDGQGDTVSDYVDYEPWVVDAGDMDMDGIPDEWEIGYFGNTDTIDETTDYDAEGLIDSDEFTYNTDPTDTDTDDDGKSDKDEVDAGTDPLDPQS